MKVAFVAMAETRTLAPFSDPSWEIWSCHDGTIPRWDRWFQVHRTIADFLNDAVWKLRGDGRPIYMHHHHAQVQGSVAYPRDRMVARFGSEHLTCTAALAMALAIDEMVPRGTLARPGQHTLGLWGVEMLQGSEFAYQRPACQHFLRLAAELGIEVVLPDACDLLNPVMVYGIDAPSPAHLKLLKRLDFVRQYRDALMTTESQLEVALADIRAKMNQNKGQHEVLRGLIDTGFGMLGAGGVKTDEPLPALKLVSE